MTWLVTRQTVSPVRSAARVAERLADGHLTERMTVHGQDEMATLARSFNEMAESLQEQIRRMEELSTPPAPVRLGRLARAAHPADHDPDGG